jgi:hypothetical protein
MITKTFPQENNTFIEKTKNVSNGKSSFQNKKIINFTSATPASKCISIKDKFDNYIVEKYNHLTQDQKEILWRKVTENFLNNTNNNFNDIVDGLILKI